MINSENSQIELQEKQDFLMEAARHDLLTFCQITKPNYECTWFHEIIAYKLETSLDKAMRGEKVRLILTIPPRHGKQLSNDTVILSTKGWTTHGQLKKGEYVFNELGYPVKVLEVSEESYSDNEVTFSDGQKIIAHDNHEWVVRTWSNKSKEIVVETKEMVRKGLSGEGKLGKRGHRYRFSVDHVIPVELPKKKYVLHPYFLGLWLGNGTTGVGLICGAPKDIDAQLKKLETFGIKDAKITIQKNTGVKYARMSHLNDSLRKIKVFEDKHIPEEYLTGSIEQRLDLLAGLIDTDGSKDKFDRYIFSNTNKRIIDSMIRLVSSLGGQTYVQEIEPELSSSGIQGRKKVYTLGFNLPNFRIPVALERKKQTNNRKFAYRRRSIVAINKIAQPVKGKCIQVEGGVYLAGEKLIPTHNSELASIRFPAFAIGKYPNIEFILTTYGAELSETMGMKTRDVINSEAYQAIFNGIELRADQKSKAKWMTNKGGSFTAVATSSAVTGVGANCILIDDIHKSREEAESANIRETVWQYYRDTLYSRLEGYGAIIIIMQRWHTDDLVGRVLEESEKRKKAGEPYDEWEVINFPAIAEEDEYHEGKLIRKTGDPLWKRKFPLDVLANIRAASLYKWSSQYQQQPISSETQEFKDYMFKKWTAEMLQGKYLTYMTFIDPAISQKKEGDNTVVLTIAKEVDGPNFYRIREDAGHFTPSQTVDLIFAHNAEYHSDVWIETVAYQASLKYAIQDEQRRKQRYFMLTDIKTSSNKEVRIRGLLPLYQNGVIWHSPTDHEYEREALVFPKGKHDDRIDCMSFILAADLKQGRGVKKFIPKWIGHKRA